MLWSENIPTISVPGVEVKIISGALSGMDLPPPPPCPPKSWASQPENNVNIMTIRLEPNASWILPPSFQALEAVGDKLMKKCLYYFTPSEGLTLDDGQPVPLRTKLDIDPFKPVKLSNRGSGLVELLLLEGKSINEPVVQHGPFVMNTRDEIMQAFTDYQRTEFGRWPWKTDDPVHDRHKGRFAKYPDGRLEEPQGSNESSSTGAADEATCS
jgi:quercetin 2,3-dioxygenase